MPARDKRMKASDVFNAAHHVFARKVSFEEAYPDIDEITVEVSESSMGSSDPPLVSKYTKATVGQFVDCSNDRCYNGGVNIGSIISAAVGGLAPAPGYNFDKVNTGSIISAAVGERKTEHTETRTCQGYEGSRKGRKRYRSCLHTFKVTVKVQYKEQPSGDPAPPADDPSS